MKKRTHTKLVHEGKYVAEVDIELIDTSEGWSPYLALPYTLHLIPFRFPVRPTPNAESQSLPHSSSSPRHHVTAKLEERSRKSRSFGTMSLFTLTVNHRLQLKMFNDWSELYGLGRGLWNEEDAQDYNER